MKMGRLAAVAAALLATSGTASAAVPAPLPRVVLVRPAAAPASVSEALVRLRGELIGAGFDADVLDLPLGADVRASLEKFAPPAASASSANAGPASGKSATALVAVVASADPGSAELWVIDRVTGKTVVRRVNAAASDPARVAEILAVRAVELLRASFLELAITPASEAAAPGPPAPPAVERWATAPLDARDWTWAIEAGGATALAVSGPWNAFLPVARVERALGRRACIRVGFAGLGTASRVSTPNGSADLSQTVFVAETLLRFRRGHRLEPLISAGAGALRLDVDAHPGEPYQAAGGARWGAAGDMGVGVRIPLDGRRFELGAEAHAVFAQPFPTAQYFGHEIARVGRPTLLATMTLLGGL
ncbi:MAG TPA: hypothetical protein VHO67_05520 [Polyangia bacterium]|nr:hypothetical protein [Polyangia bacterium]